MDFLPTSLRSSLLLPTRHPVALNNQKTPPLRVFFVRKMAKISKNLPDKGLSKNEIF